MAAARGSLHSFAHGALVCPIHTKTQTTERATTVATGRIYAIRATSPENEQIGVISNSGISSGEAIILL